MQNNRVYVVPSYLMQRQGLSLVTATSILANYVYPDTFNEDVSRLLEIDGTASSAVSESPASSASSETASSSAPSSTASSSTSSTSSTTVDTPSSVPETQIAEEGVLQEGDQGEEVVRLQQRLQELGFMNYGTVNGYSALPPRSLSRTSSCITTSWPPGLSTRPRAKPCILRTLSRQIIKINVPYITKGPVFIPVLFIVRHTFNTRPLPPAKPDSRPAGYEAHQ